MPLQGAKIELLICGKHRFEYLVRIKFCQKIKPWQLHSKTKFGLSAKKSAGNLDFNIEDLFGRSLKWLQVTNFILQKSLVVPMNNRDAYVFCLMQNKICRTFAHSCPAEQV